MEGWAALVEVEACGTTGVVELATGMMNVESGVVNGIMEVSSGKLEVADVISGVLKATSGVTGMTTLELTTGVLKINGGVLEVKCGVMTATSGLLDMMAVALVVATGEVKFTSGGLGGTKVVEGSAEILSVGSSVAVKFGDTNSVAQVTPASSL